MVRRLIRLRERVIEVAAFKKEDHRYAGTFGWHRPGQDNISSRGTWHCRQGACEEEVQPEAAVARKMVCYMMAVERRQEDFVPAGESMPTEAA
jgi:hypothetical protein